MIEIKNLSELHKPAYLMCLEEWSDEMKQAGDRKTIWYEKIKDKGLRVKVAIDEKENVVGMIQYIPIEQSFAQGENLYHILCIWVHGYNQGVGNFQKRGIGKLLLKAAEEDVKSLSFYGISAWGVSLPFWMKASWFKKQGYLKVDKHGMGVLLWKPFNPNAKPPKWIKLKRKPKKIPGKVTVTSFINGWCPAQNSIYERAKKAASEFGDKVIFKEIDTSNRQVFLEWGIGDALFIDDKSIRTGPPPTYEAIKKKIQKRVNKLK